MAWAFAVLLLLLLQRSAAFDLDMSSVQADKVGHCLWLPVSLQGDQGGQQGERSMSVCTSLVALSHVTSHLSCLYYLAFP